MLGLLQILEGQHRAACDVCGHLDEDGSTPGCDELAGLEPCEPPFPQAPAAEPDVVSGRCRATRWTRCFGV
jgi:hypothetical protein